MSDTFNAENINEAHRALQASRDTPDRSTSIFDPVHEVEILVSSLLSNRISRITEDDYEDVLKDTIRARLPEASFSELTAALASFQINSNMALERLLAPFLPRAGERVPLLDKNKEEDNEKKISNISEGASKEILQALAELPKLLDTITKASGNVSQEDGEAIKKALKDSLKLN